MIMPRLRVWPVVEAERELNRERPTVDILEDQQALSQVPGSSGPSTGQSTTVRPMKSPTRIGALALAAIVSAGASRAAGPPTTANTSAVTSALIPQPLILKAADFKAYIDR